MAQRKKLPLLITDAVSAPACNATLTVFDVVFDVVWILFDPSLCSGVYKEVKIVASQMPAASAVNLTVT